MAVTGASVAPVRKSFTTEGWYGSPSILNSAATDPPPGFWMMMYPVC